jgi:hypothetical protein
MNVQLNRTTVMALAVTTACLVPIGCGGVQDPDPAPVSGVVFRGPSGPGLSDGLAWRERDRVAPTVNIDDSTTVGPAGLVGLTGMAADDQQLQRVRWSNNRGGSGLATLTGSTQNTRRWVATVPLQTGSNTITVTAVDAAGNRAQAATVVIRTALSAVRAPALVSASN